MSAGLLVDLGNTAQQGVSISPTPFLSGGLIAAASGNIIGQSVNMINANTYCNVELVGVSASGQIRIQVQTADSDTSGSYTDPTSGLAQLPGVFASGGIIWVNSGGTGQGVFSPFASGNSLASGFAAATAFQRPGQFVRANILTEGSQQYAGPLTVAFVSQLKTTGSGGGFSYAPQGLSGGNTVNV